MKTKRFFKVSGFWRFALSYFSILILPLFFFVLFSERFFIGYYRNEALRQSADALEKRQSDFETELNQMYAISAQISAMNATKSYNLARNVIAYIEIRSGLERIKATHSFFDRLSFFCMATPNVLYTDIGTFNSYYYRHYIREGVMLPISSRIKGVTGREWLLPQESTLAEKMIYFEKSLQLVIPMPGNDESYCLFDISEGSMASMLNLPDSVFLFDGKGRLLYPFMPLSGEASAKITAGYGKAQSLVRIGEKDYYQINTFSKAYDLQFVQLVEKDYLLRDITAIQRKFGFLILAGALIGGVFVYLVAFFNYRPIRSLNILAKRTIQEIPDNLSGIAQAAFALNKMDEMYHSLEQKRALEQFMISLIHGRVHSREEWKKSCAETGIVIPVGCLYSAMIELNQTNIEDQSLIQKVQKILAPGYKVYGIQYPRQGSLLLLIDAGEDSGGLLRNRMQEASDLLAGFTEGGEAPQITIGGVCTDFSQLPRSYMQVVMAVHFKDSPFENRVFLFDELPHSVPTFVYPDAELSSLYESIVNADLEKTLLITDILIDMVRAQSYNPFLCNSLCYSIINVYFRAQEELHLNWQGNENREIADVSISSYPGIENLIDMIYRLRDKTSAFISKGAEPKLYKKDISTQVAEYIDSHYNDSSLWVSSIADIFNMSISNLSHQFKASTGVNLSDYIFKKKMICAKELLSSSDLTINEISLRIGYTQTASFIRKFKSHMNMTPYEYKQLIKKDGI
jgi:AraC-like DNA-binding protein/HAMP domain-containing protein